MNQKLLEILDTSSSMHEMYDRICAEIPENTAIVFNDDTVSYAQLREKVDNLATSLLNKGVSKDDRIAVIIPTRPEFVYVWLAASKIGAAIVGLNFRYTEDEVKYMVNDSGASHLICIREFNGVNYPEFINGFLPEMPSVKEIIYLDNGNSPADGNLDELIATSADKTVIDALSTEGRGDVDNFIIYTSGTTGKPKGVVIKQKNILAMIRPWLRHLELDESDRFMCMLPLSHVGGGTISALTALAAGSQLVLHEIFHPVVMVEALQKHQITIFGGVPTLFEITFALIPDTIPKISADMFPNLKTIIWGGAPGTAETIAAMRERFGADILGCYGSSEVSGFCSYMSPADSIEKAVSLGKPPKEVEMKLVHPKTKENVNKSEIGEIAVRSDMVFDRYLGNPEATEDAFSQDGWFYTGDLATEDNDGFYHIAGRSKEMYICGGFNVYPKEVEDKLAEHPNVVSSAVISMPHQKMGECGWAYVVPKTGTDVTEQELLEHCKKKMADYKVPERVFLVDSIPISPVGKILKNQLKETAMTRFDT